MCLVLLHPVVERVVLSSYKLLFSYFACLLLLMLLLAYSLGLTTAVHSLLALPLNKYPDCRIYRAVQNIQSSAVQNIQSSAEYRIYRAVQNIQSSAARQVFRKSKQKHVTTVHVASPEETPLASCSRTHFLSTGNSRSGTLTSLYHFTSPAVCARSHPPDPLVLPHRNF